EPDENYVRICDAYGSGYIFIPGTESCMKVSGYVRSTLQGGTNAYSGTPYGGWRYSTRFALTMETARETELGTLKTFAEVHFNYKEAKNDEEYAYISLGGFQVGYAPSAFTNYIYLGNVVMDDVVSQGSFSQTGQISYTYTNPNGLTGVVALEQGSGDFVIDDYTPYLVGSVQYAKDWGSLASSIAYDPVVIGWSGQLNAAFNLSDKFSVWA